MERSNLIALVLLLIVVLIFIMISVYLLYYAYCLNTNDTSEDIIAKTTDDIHNFITNFKIPISINPVKPPNSVILNELPLPKKEEKMSECEIAILSTIPPGSSSPIRLKKSSIIPDDVTNNKLYIIESISPAIFNLPKIGSVSLKFWNNSNVTHTITSNISILDDTHGGKNFSIKPGQFVSIESVEDFWLVTHKTKSQCHSKKIAPTEPIQSNLDDQIKDLMNSSWSDVK